MPNDERAKNASVLEGKFQVEPEEANSRRQIVCPNRILLRAQGEKDLETAGVDSKEEKPLLSKIGLGAACLRSEKRESISQVQTKIVGKSSRNNR